MPGLQRGIQVTAERHGPRRGHFRQVLPHHPAHEGMVAGRDLRARTEREPCRRQRRAGRADVVCGRRHHGTAGDAHVAIHARRHMVDRYIQRVLGVMLYHLSLSLSHLVCFVRVYVCKRINVYKW